MNKQPKNKYYKDTPATRKRRLQERLQEISAKSEQELAALMSSMEKLKRNWKPQAKRQLSDQTGGKEE